MKGKREVSGDDMVRMELKYCEHCGGLWLRRSGVGTVYCEKCKSKVAELPAPKKKPGRIFLPVQRTSVIEGFEHEIEENEMHEIDADDLDFEAAAGGAA
jgi:ribosomal protein L37AE/L43A